MSDTRVIVLDTETTGLSPEEGDRIIEVACVEICDFATTRTVFHSFFNPEREIAGEAVQVHGMTWDDLMDAPRFVEKADQIVSELEDCQLVAHNATFDIGFLNHELGLANKDVKVDEICEVIDSVALARKKLGGRVDLDTLCNKLKIDASNRTKHSALLDAELTALVYVRLSSGEIDLLDTHDSSLEVEPPTAVTVQRDQPLVIYATEEEVELHTAYMKSLEQYQK